MKTLVIVLAASSLLGGIGLIFVDKAREERELEEARYDASYRTCYTRVQPGDMKDCGKRASCDLPDYQACAHACNTARARKDRAARYACERACEGGDRAACTAF